MARGMLGFPDNTGILCKCQALKQSSKQASRAAVTGRRCGGSRSMAEEREEGVHPALSRSRGWRNPRHNAALPACRAVLSYPEEVPACRRLQPPSSCRQPKARPPTNETAAHYAHPRLVGAGNSRLDTRSVHVDACCQAGLASTPLGS